MTTEITTDLATDIRQFMSWWDIPVNDAQVSFIGAVHEPGHAVGRAVPGSGKTSCIVSMVHYLTRGRMKVGLDEILVCSFNTSCAALIRDRLSRISAAGERRFARLSRTYHSVGFEICRLLGRGHLTPSRHEILVKAMELHASKFGPMPMDLKDFGLFITFAKNRGAYVMSETDLNTAAFIPEDVPAQFGLSGDQIATMLRCYEFAKGDMIDYDDQILLPYMKFVTGDTSCFKPFSKIRFLLVDELQDANRAQMGMVKAIEQVSGCKVIGVGDGDQAIYGFRGAVCKNMDEFIAGFGAKEYQLPHNYRSGWKILEAASSVIRTNPDRKDYAIIAGRPKARGEIILVNCPDIVREFDALAHIIMSISTCGDFEGGPFRRHRILVLSRTNNVLGQAARHLFSNGIPVVARMDEIQGEFVQMLNSVAACLWHQNADLREVLKSIKLIGPKRADAMCPSGGDLDAIRPDVIGKGKINMRVTHFISQLRKLRVPKDELDRVLADPIEFSILVMKVRNLLAEFANDYADHMAIAIRAELSDSSSFLVKMADKMGVSKCIQTLYDMGDVDLTKDREDAVELMTVHRAKGQENGAVIIIDAHNFPCVYADEADEGYHQETNLLFVAATRAKDLLIVTRSPRVKYDDGERSDHVSHLLDDVKFDRVVQYTPKDMDPFHDCFPIRKEAVEKPKPKKWELVDWPTPVKEFEGGKDFELFKDQFLRKVEQEGFRVHTHAPPLVTHFPDRDPRDVVAVLTGSAPEMMSRSIKGEEERSAKQHSWLCTASKTLSDAMGPGWRASVYQKRFWARNVWAQKDVIFDMHPPKDDGATSESLLVASLVASISGHPRVIPSLRMFVSHVRLRACRGAENARNLVRFDCMPVTGPLGMLLWRGDKEYSKSVKPDEGFHSALGSMLNHIGELKAIETSFNTFSRSETLFEAAPLPFHPGGHLWIHAEPDCLWPFHPPGVNLVHAMSERIRPPFDQAGAPIENGFYDLFRKLDQPSTPEQFLEFTDAVTSTYFEMPEIFWSHVVARAFNVPTSNVASESTGKRIMFTIAKAKDMSFPEAGFDTALLTFMRRPVSVKIM